MIFLKVKNRLNKLTIIVIENISEKFKNDEQKRNVMEDVF